MAQAQAQQDKKELGSPDRSGLNTVAIQYPPVMIAVVLLKTPNHTRHRSAVAASKNWRSLAKRQANHGRDLEHTQRLIDLDHNESAAALSECLCTELWKQEGETAHPKHQNTNIIFSYTVMFSRSSQFLPGALKLFFGK